MNKLDVYDFDGTIYNGDSSIDFLIYAMKKKKSLIKYLPKIVLFVLLNKLGIIPKKKSKQVYFSFIKGIDNLEEFVEEFWKAKENKINSFFLENMKEKKNTYVISASPEFLLRPYISKFENIKLIGTRIDKNAKLIGENCKRGEKIKRLDAVEKDYVIENFYTDALVDLPLVKKSKKSYYVHKGKVEEWNINKVKNDEATKNSKILFLFFLIFYFTIGMLLSYNYNFNTLDLLFNADTNRVINDISEIFMDHYRLTVHPLFVILTQPIYFIVGGITQEKMIALMLISSAVSALSVAILYKTIVLFSNKNKINMIVAMCYGFTFTNFIFTASIEVYNIAALALILFWYFIIKKVKQGWEKLDFIILIILGILTLAITITNYVIFLIGCLVLLISKKVNFRKLLIANILIVIITIGFNYFQNCIWQNTALCTELFFTKDGEVRKEVENKEDLDMNDERKYMDFTITVPKVKTVVRNCIYNPIISARIGMETRENDKKIIVFEHMRKSTLIILSLFFLTIAIFTLKNFRKNMYINVGLVLALIFNCIFHVVYGNEGTSEACFLYSMHFTYLIFLLFAANCLNEKNKKVKLSILTISSILLLAEVLVNCKTFLKVIEFVAGIRKANIFAENFNLIQLILGSMFIIIALIVFIKLISYFISKIKNNKQYSIKGKYIILTFICIIALESIFVSLKTISKNKKMLWMDFTKNEEVIEEKKG